MAPVVRYPWRTFELGLQDCLHFRWCCCRCWYLRNRLLQDRAHRAKGVGFLPGSASQPRIHVIRPTSTGGESTCKPIDEVRRKEFSFVGPADIRHNAIQLDLQQIQTCLNTRLLDPPLNFAFLCSGFSSHLGLERQYSHPYLVGGPTLAFALALTP